MMDALPKDAHYELAFGDIFRQYFARDGAFYIDLWPLSELYLAVISPTAAIQAAQTSGISCERPRLLERFFKPITGGPNLFDLSEKKWRPWRAIFNKGFSTEHVLSLVPGMISITSTYCDTLRKHAQKGDMFLLDPTTLRFTMDLIGKTVLNTTLGAQTGSNVLADSMLSQIRWHQPNAEVNPLEYLNFPRWYVHWRNGRQMDDCIGEELDKRYSEYRADPESTRTKAVIDLVIQAYISHDKERLPEKLDPVFRIFAIRQIRLFFFAGHDSTSSTICYIIHLLSTNPTSLAYLREEHDRVLGPNPSDAASLLSLKPQLAKSLPYTQAVIKESLRLFTPAAATRAGKPSVSLTSDAGTLFPTEDAIILIVHVELHRSPKYWLRPDDFIPDRWLVGPEHELYPSKGAWRAFEHGPRNCIGQDLVMVQLSVLLAIVAREFDFRNCYEEWDSLNPRKGTKRYRGERAYQIENGAAHPADGYPCRVFLRDELKHTE
ncbi:MAG: hypothetical protein LQ342_003118 [Letrouitia transgressa]|nr:MAG: hypothetical protein LQ342_003118 [Letrouitia transgressa]